MSGRNEKISPIRFSVVQYVTLIVFLVLSYGLWRLQIANSDTYSVRAEQNRIKRVPILAPRGKIYDRDGTLIVDNYPSFSALLLRDQMRDLTADAGKIAEGLHISADDLREKITRYKLAHVPNFQPIIIKEDITPDERAYIEAHKDEFPELETIMMYRRLYPKNGFMAPLIGYVGEVSEDMLNSPKFDIYERGDIVGQSGIEQEYNDLLMGKNGSRRVIVDSRGREVVDGRGKSNRWTEEPASPGQNLKLTIDLDVQKAAEQAMEGWNGALVAMNPRNGEILAMVSRPTFDPNDFAVRISRQDWKKLIDDPAHPLMNKAIQAQLAPGSVFKIVMSVAGLQEGVAENMKVNCTGHETFYGRVYACHEKKGHGEIEISRAISQSCDVFFYTLANRLGIEKIARWATAMGIGQKTGIDLPNEEDGLMPSEEWKIKTFHQKWYAGEVISVGIGQGAITVTPVQIARTIGGITMGGVFYRPHVVNPSALPTAFRNMMNVSNTPVHVHIDPQNWIRITDAMAGVVAPGGTAASAHLQGVDFAGKTGTAQVASLAFIKAHKNDGKNYKDNVWFAGVAPRRNPEIVVVALLEHGVSSSLAGRVAAQVIKAYVEKQRMLRNNPLLFSDKADPGSVPIAALWTGSQSDQQDKNKDADARDPAEDLHGGSISLRMQPGTGHKARRVSLVRTPAAGAP